MQQLEVFFDYACPYCWQGHQNLMDLLPGFPEIEVAWRPCESHPRPERWPQHSDLLIQGLLFAMESGADLQRYHERAYALALRRKVNVEDAGAVAAGFADLLDASALRTALHGGKYAQAQRRANDYAFEQSGVWVVPAYRMSGRRLDSVENIGVTIMQLRKFLEG
ncbi:MAG: DsbA family protein [Oscillospiraceae bacterium]|jgi:predicted DsbA family dithiol-disulfide isomerase|nr:DsbA family protein [Oscillospiraceae bacterium]